MLELFKKLPVGAFDPFHKRLTENKLDETQYDAENSVITFHEKTAWLKMTSNIKNHGLQT